MKNASAHRYWRAILARAVADRLAGRLPFVHFLRTPKKDSQFCDLLGTITDHSRTDGALLLLVGWVLSLGGGINK